MTTVRNSLGYSIATSYFSLPLQIIGTMVMARLLTPAETGVFAVAAVFSAFASTFRDFGVAEYVIQEKDLTADKIRAALTVTISISWCMALLLFACAPAVANFYRDTGIADVMRVQALNLLFVPFGAVTMAYFRRQLNFRPIFIGSMLGNIASFAVAVLFALNGFGYMSLAWSSLAGVVAMVAASVWFTPPDFPRLPGTRGIGRVVQFGKFASGIYIFGQIGKGAPEMIIGRVQDLVGVAMFSRAYGLVELFNRGVLNAVIPVCLPYFAQDYRQSGSIVSGYLKSMAYITAIGWPFFAFVGIVPYAAIRIFYGSQWIDAVPLAQILCLVGAIELVHYLAKEALIAVDDVKRSNSLQIGLQSARVASLFAVVPFGLTGACFGLLAAALFGLWLSQWNLYRACGLRLTDVVRTCVPSVLITAICVSPIALWEVFEPVGELNYLRFLFVGGSITATLWVLSLRLLRHPLWTEIVALFKKLGLKIGMVK